MAKSTSAALRSSSSLILAGAIILLSIQLPPLCLADEGPESGIGVAVFDFTTDVAVDIDGFRVDPSLVEETNDDSLRSQEERHREASTTRHPFEKTCPYGYFVCTNGECIASKWRCDSHYDCDDFSDELNCSSLDIPQHGLVMPASTTYVTPPPKPNVSSSAAAAATNAATTAPVPAHIKFNSSIEPLMIFSTGASIRGFWMQARLYFDVVTRGKLHSASTAQASITDAVSLFFGLLGGASRPAKAEDSMGASAAGGAKPESTIVGLDMDPQNKEVYWVELGRDPGVYSAVIEDEQFEARHKRQHHRPKKVVEFGLLSPEDIALDLIGKNAYITDAGLPAVIVCSYTDVDCKIIVHDGIHKPRAIIVDSATGWLAFSDWGDHAGIFLVSMDGRFRETLLETDVVWPNGLALDESTNSLYWADARLNKIERVDLKTRRREIIIKEIGTNPFSVSVFESRVYWSDWSKNEIKTCDKLTGNDTQVLMNADDIYGIHIYHPDLHKRDRTQSSPCWAKHCSHLCLVGPMAKSFDRRSSASLKATCACPDSMVLSSFDKATCLEVESASLMVNVRNYIAEVWPDRIGVRPMSEVIYTRDHAIQDMAVDWNPNQRLFFFDASTRSILEADFSTRRHLLANITHTGAKSSVRGLTYDWMSDNLYWLDNTAGQLVLYSIVGDFQTVLRRNLAKPTSMVLDTKNRVFYIACADNVKPYIMRTDITGDERTDVKVVSSSDAGRSFLPVSLYLDEQLQRLYWADAKAQTIESVELDIKSHATGTRMKSLTIHRQNLGVIVSFTVFQDSFVWMLADDPYLYKARIRPGKNSRPLSFKMPHGHPAHQFPEADYKRLITINPAGPEPPASPCHTLACSHGCVLDPTHEPKCICPNAYKLSINNRTNCVQESVHEECQNCLPAVVSSMQALNLSHASGHHPTVPGSGPLSNIIKHLDGQQTAAAATPTQHGSQASAAAAAATSVSVKLPGPLEPEDKNALAAALKRIGAHDDWIFDHSIRADHHHGSGEDAAATHESHTSALVHSASDGASVEAVAESGNKMVWLIVFLLILSAGGLLTMLSLLMLHKQGRLPNPVAVSFIAPGGHASSSYSSQDKDRAMLLLDTDN